MFGTSVYCHRLMSFLSAVQNSGPIVRVDDSSDVEKVLSLEDSPIPHGFIDGNYGQTSFWRQYFMLVRRGYTVAIRDPALYLLQFLLLLIFGFMVGAVFLRMKYTIDSTLVNVPASITWIVFVMAYLQIFKVKKTIYTSYYADLLT